MQLIQPGDVHHLASLRNLTLAALKDVVGDSGDVAVVDAPNQRNVGDSLIWAGELAYLKQLGLSIRYTADIGSLVPADLRRRMASGTILIHGGGNFGDIWAGHQEHRELILREFTDYRVVQLPQSIWFSGEEEASRANKAMSAHPDFTALLRDTESMERAAEQLPGITVRFCHDMAFGFTPRTAAVRRRQPTVALVLARSDKEEASGLATTQEPWAAGIPTLLTDWTNRGADQRLWLVCRKVTNLHRRYAQGRRAGRIRPLPLVDAVGTGALRLINRLNIRGGVKLYRNARFAVVDRLHAHVLACLLGTPHVLLDNSYGKLGAVYRDYSGEFSTAHYAKNSAEARRWVDHLLQDGEGRADR